MNNYPGTTPAPTKSLAQCSKPCWSECASQLGETHHLDISSMGCVVTVHPLVMSEPIMQGQHSPFLGEVTMGHPCLQCLPWQCCGSSTRTWGYHNAIDHSIPHLLSCGQHWCFITVTKVFAVSSQVPAGFYGCGTHLQVHMASGFI